MFFSKAEQVTIQRLIQAHHASNGGQTSSLSPIQSAECDHDGGADTSLADQLPDLHLEMGSEKNVSDEEIEEEEDS